MLHTHKDVSSFFLAVITRQSELAVFQGVTCAAAEAGGLHGVKVHYGVQLLVNNEAGAQRENAVPLNQAWGDGKAAKQRKPLCSPQVTVW